MNFIILPVLKLLFYRHEQTSFVHDCIAGTSLCDIFYVIPAPGNYYKYFVECLSTFYCDRGRFVFYLCSTNNWSDSHNILPYRMFTNNAILIIP